jgi:hypothetical protein
MPLPITLSFKLSFERKEEREKVIKLMRLWSSASGLSPLKPILVEGVLDRVRNMLAPVGFAGAGS